MTAFSLRNTITLVVYMLLPVTTICQTGTTKVERDLFRIERKLNEADARHDTKVASKYLDDEYIVKSFEDKKLYDKAATLDAIRRMADPKHPDPLPLVEGLKATVLNGSALVTFNYTVVTDKETLRCEMVDTFLKRPSGWKLAKRTGTCH